MDECIAEEQDTSEGDLTLDAVSFNVATKILFNGGFIHFHVPSPASTTMMLTFAGKTIGDISLNLEILSVEN